MGAARRRVAVGEQEAVEVLVLEQALEGLDETGPDSRRVVAEQEVGHEGQSPFFIADDRVGQREESSPMARCSAVSSGHSTPTSRARTPGASSSPNAKPSTSTPLPSNSCRPAS